MTDNQNNQYAAAPIRQLEDGEIAVVWTIDDVCNAHETVTDDVARKVLNIMKRCHDASTGIDQDVIETTIYNVMEGHVQAGEVGLTDSIEIIWSREDVQSVRQDLDDEQAQAVLMTFPQLKKDGVPVCWTSISDKADEMYPPSNVQIKPYSLPL